MIIALVISNLLLGATLIRLSLMPGECHVHVLLITISRFG